MTPEQRFDIVLYRLNSAKSLLDEIKDHIERGYYNTAMNRMYYACFYAVSGLLLQSEIYNPQIQISAESGTKRSIFRQKNKTKRSKKRLRTTLIKSEQKVNETSVPALYFRKNTFRMAF